MAKLELNNTNCEVIIIIAPEMDAIPKYRKVSFGFDKEARKQMNIKKEAQVMPN